MGLNLSLGRLKESTPMLLAMAMLSAGSCLVGIGLSTTNAVKELMNPQHERRPRERTLNEMRMSLAHALQEGRKELNKICGDGHQAGDHNKLLAGLHDWVSRAIRENKGAIDQNPALNQEAAELLFDITSAIMIVPPPPEPRQLH